MHLFRPIIEQEPACFVGDMFKTGIQTRNMDYFKRQMPKCLM